MAHIITSAFGGQDITVDSLMADPAFIPEQVIEQLTGQFIEEVIFRNGGTNDGVVAFRETVSAFLSDDAEEVAEFGEIPVASPQLGDLKAAYGIKTALGVRVSREMKRENKIDQLNLNATQLMNTMVRGGVRATVGVFKAADVTEREAGEPWGTADATPAHDVLDAIEDIQSAAPDNADDDETFGYEPDLIVAHPLAITKLTRDPQIQKLYIGDIASENPLYKGMYPKTICGLEVATSRFLGANDFYVLQRGVGGFISDTDPLSATPFYEEGGASGAGGPNQSWRSDVWRKRAIAVDNPKAIVKITAIA